MVQANHNQDLRTKPSKIAKQNRFWSEVADQSVSEADNAATRLIKDLRNYQPPEFPPTGLLQYASVKLERLVIPAINPYNGVENQTAINIFDGGTYGCDSCGTFTPAFLRDFERANKGNLEGLIKPVPVTPASLPINLAPFAWSMLEYLVYAFTISGAFGFAIAHCVDAYKHDWLTRTWKLDGVSNASKLVVMLAFWPYFIVRILAIVTLKLLTIAKSSFIRRRSDKELNKLLNQSQVGLELIRARASLKQLETMRRRTVRPSVKSMLDQNILDTEELVVELENRILNGIRQSNNNVRERLKALDQAYAEVEVL